MTKHFPWNSSYAFAENRVISGIDLDGGECKDVNGNSPGPLNESYALKIGASIMPGFKTESQFRAENSQAILKRFDRNYGGTEATIKPDNILEHNHDMAMAVQIGDGVRIGLETELTGMAIGKAFRYAGQALKGLEISGKIASIGAGYAKNIPAMAQRFSIAERFYKAMGYVDKEARLSHMLGIDLTKSVETQFLKKGTTVNQWVGKGGVGSYFTEGTNFSKNLGISYENRVLKQFTLTEYVEVLKSTASTLNGNTGGGTQYFSPKLKNLLK